MTTFTAADGKRYRATGEFKPAKDGDRWYWAHIWHVRKDHNPECGEDYDPVIHVTPVEPEYDVKLRINERMYQYLKVRAATESDGTLDDELIRTLIAGVKNDDFKEVTE